MVSFISMSNYFLVIKYYSIDLSNSSLLITIYYEVGYVEKYLWIYTFHSLGNFNYAWLQFLIPRPIIYVSEDLIKRGSIKWICRRLLKSKPSLYF